MSCFSHLSELPPRLDAIFVINQELKFEQIEHLFDKYRIEDALFVTSHAPFPEEQADFQERAGAARLIWMPMSWLLTDLEMEACDDQAVAELTSGALRLDMEAYYKRSRFLRNQKACLSLARHTEWDHCFSCNGLGVVSLAWNGSILLNPLELPNNQGGSYSRNIGAISQRLLPYARSFNSRVVIEMVEQNHEAYAFIGGSTRRLRFRETVRTSRLTKRVGFRGRKDVQNALRRLVAATSRRLLPTPLIVATTVHNFSPWMLDCFPGIRVFVDGLHPPNYPISYGAAYRGAVIVSREESDRLWFEKCGCEVVPPASILAPEYSCSGSVPSKPIRNICLMLNHAGDWSALIDRSDTDLTVMTFAEVADSLSELQFRIRAHPTMSHPAHEGVGSLERLRLWIDRLDLNNLQFSQGTLDEDMSWADCCVSEYSNVLVDCLKAGKLCYGLNPTNRRSFLDWFTAKGLKIASNSNDLLCFLYNTAIIDNKFSPEV